MPSSRSVGKGTNLETRHGFFKVRNIRRLFKLRVLSPLGLKMQTSSSSSFASPRGETVLSQTVDKTPIQAEQHVRNVSKNPTKSPKPELRAVFVSMDVTSSASQQKRFVNRLGQFVASQLRKRKVEVSVKNLLPRSTVGTSEEKRDTTASTERGNGGSEENEENRDDELMGLRWVVTVKHFPEEKVKARSVTLAIKQVI